MNTDLPHTEELADNSEESDFDPEEPTPANMSTETGDPLPELTDSESDEEQMVPAPPAPSIDNTLVLRVRLAPVTFNAPVKQTAYQRYNNDESYRTTRNALVNTKVRKYFAGYGTYHGIITSVILSGSPPSVHLPSVK
jgi:hypothetical protein